jgi:hypothetical protein
MGRLGTMSRLGTGPKDGQVRDRSEKPALGKEQRSWSVEGPKNCTREVTEPP